MEEFIQRDIFLMNTLSGNGGLFKQWSVLDFMKLKNRREEESAASGIKTVSCWLV